MKLKTTKKTLLDNYGKDYALTVGYCDLQHLLRGAEVEPFAYTSGVCGWNFDAYDFNGILITTGYRGMIGKPAINTRKYEEKAKKVFEKYSFKDFDKRKRACLKLLENFIKDNFKKKGV